MKSNLIIADTAVSCTLFPNLGLMGQSLLAGMNCR
jgi:hypothetical protein